MTVEFTPLLNHCANAGVGGTGRNELIICNNVFTSPRRISNYGFGADVNAAPVGGVGKMIEWL